MRRFGAPLTENAPFNENALSSWKFTRKNQAEAVAKGDGSGRGGGGDVGSGRRVCGGADAVALVRGGGADRGGGGRDLGG